MSGARDTLALLIRVSRACGHNMRRAADALVDAGHRSLAFDRVTGCGRYVMRLHDELPSAAARDAAVPALHDALSWGLLAYVHELAEHSDAQRDAAARLYDALAPIARTLRARGVALRKTRLLQRAEARHPRVTDDDLRKTFDLAIRRVTRRALADARAPEGRGRTATESARRAVDEFQLIAAALINHRARLTQPSLAVLDRDLDEAIAELVRWGSDDGDPLSVAWVELFQRENELRVAARLPPHDRHLALGASPADVVALLTTPSAPGRSTSSTDAAIDRIGLALERISDGRLRAGRNLERQLHEPERPATPDLAAMILSTALSMAVAGVGGFIASRVVAQLQPDHRARALVAEGTDHRLAPIIASLEPLGVFGPPPGPAAPHLDAGLAEAIQALVGGVVPTDQVAGWLLPGRTLTPHAAQISALTATILRDPRSRFIAGLERGLAHTRDRTRQAFIEHKGLLRTVAVEQLQEIERRLDALAAKAEDAQLYVTMLEWMNFVARWQLGAIEASERAAVLSDGIWHTAPGVVTVDLRVDRERPGSGPLTLHDARAGISGPLWKGIQQVAGDLPVGRLPVNQLYRFFLGTQFAESGAIRVRVQAPVGTSVTHGNDDVVRRALAAVALDRPFSLALDGAIRHGPRVDHDAGARAAKDLAAVGVRDLYRARKSLVELARATPVAKVRADP